MGPLDIAMMILIGTAGIAALGLFIRVIALLRPTSIPGVAAVE